MPRPYFAAWKLGRWHIAAVLTIAFTAVLGAGYARVQAPAPESARESAGQALPLSGYRIMVDPGHGGIDPGCHRGDTFEKEIVLRIAGVLAERLRELGADVGVTRDSDVELSHLTDAERTRHRRDLAARVLLATRHRADLLVSLHVNSAASSSMGGAMVFHHPDSASGRQIGLHILKELRAVVPGNQNSVLPADYYILRHAPMTAVLIETGFISNPADRALLESDEGRARIAQAVAAGLVAAFGAGQQLPEQPEARDDTPAPAGALTGSGADGHTCQGELA